MLTLAYFPFALLFSLGLCFNDSSVKVHQDLIYHREIFEEDQPPYSRGATEKKNYSNIPKNRNNSFSDTLAERDTDLCSKYANNASYPIWCESYWRLDPKYVAISDTITIIVSVLCIVFTLITLSPCRRQRLRKKFKTLLGKEEEEDVHENTSPQYPERLLIFLSIFYYLYLIVYSSGHIFKINISECRLVGSIIDLHELLSSDYYAYCVVAFCVGYFFQNFLSFLWLIFALYCFLAVVKCWAHEALKNLEIASCFVSWIFSIFSSVIGICSFLYVPKSYTELLAVCTIGKEVNSSDSTAIFGYFLLLPLSVIIVGDVLLIVSILKVRARQKIAAECSGKKSISTLNIQLIVVFVVFNLPILLIACCVSYDYRLIEIWLNPCFATKFKIHMDGEVVSRFANSPYVTTIYFSKSFLNTAISPLLGHWMLFDWCKLVQDLQQKEIKKNENLPILRRDSANELLPMSTIPYFF